MKKAEDARKAFRNFENDPGAERAKTSIKQDAGEVLQPTPAKGLADGELFESVLEHYNKGESQGKLRAHILLFGGTWPEGTELSWQNNEVAIYRSLESMLKSDLVPKRKTVEILEKKLNLPTLKDLGPEKAYKKFVELLKKAGRFPDGEVTETWVLKKD